MIGALACGMLLALPGAVAAKTPAPAVYTYKDIKTCTKATDSVKLGALLELSGSFLTAGNPAVQGIRLAVKEMTSKGGVQVGKKCYGINLVEKDTRTDPAAAVAGARSLLQDDNVSFILGPLAGSTLLSAYQITQAATPKPIEIGVSTVLELQGVMGQPAYNGLFRALAPATISADALLAGIKKFAPAAKTIYFLWPDDAAAQLIVDRGLALKAKSRGYTVVGNDRFSTTTTDYSSYLQRVKAANPAVLLIGYLGPQITQITKQATQLGLTSQLAVWNGTPSVPLKDATGSPINIPFINLALSPDLEAPATPALKAYVKRYQAFTGGAVDLNSYWSTEFYDPTYMLVKAMQLAGTTTDTTAVGNALLKIRWDGAMGPMCWHDNHVAIIQNYLSYIVNGKVTTETWIPSKKLCVK
jgi:branched-chain amino acid transport system substrate-binding protein